ncbi:MAG TPA: tetratricopeptide repeat protein [Candidatus Binataceae bacterium]|nr:tetratricopeptide repeat protein [Candidatus Binataceae bacterium]
MRGTVAIALGATLVLLALTAVAPTAWAADLTAAGAPAAPSIPSGNTGESNAAKARALTATAINLTDSDRAVSMLWQATALDPSFEEPYLYLGLYYNSRSQFDRVVDVYQKLVKSHPNETSAWLNIGEAYMSFTPPRFNAALPYYHKGFELDPSSAFAAFRLGEIYAQLNNRPEALKYLRLASAARAKNPEIAEQADHLIHQMGS